METSRNSQLKKALGVIVLILGFAALQSPLRRPDVAPKYFAAKVGETVLFDYGRDMVRASIMRKDFASITAAGPHQLAIHAHVPGRTQLFIKYAGGDTRMYEVVVRPAGLVTDLPRLASYTDPARHPALP